jgi:hypothetical protein
VAGRTIDRVAVKDRIVESYARHGVLAIAAAGGGVSIDTLNAWAKDDPDFQARLTRAKLEKADQYLRELDVERDHKQRRWWLATMLPEHFAARSRLELTGANGGPIQVQSLAAVVIGDEHTRAAYATILRAYAGATGDGIAGRAPYGGDKGEPDAVVALPASSRARQRTPRRDEAKQQPGPPHPDQQRRRPARKNVTSIRGDGDVVPR